MHELSAAQIAYINREKRKNVRIFVSRILILILFFTFWELSADTGLIDSFIFSCPHRLIQNGIHQIGAVRLLEAQDVGGNLDQEAIQIAFVPVVEHGGKLCVV